MVGRRGNARRKKRLSDDLYKRLYRWHQEQDSDNELPDIALLGDPERAWRAFTLMEATGWRYLPEAGGLLDQDEALMSDILTIRGLDEKQKRVRKVGPVLGEEQDGKPP